MFEKLDIIITILAALVVAAVSVYGGAGLFELAYILVFTIIGFYVLGFFIKYFMAKTIGQENEKAAQEALAAPEEQIETEKTSDETIE